MWRSRSAMCEGHGVPRLHALDAAAEDAVSLHPGQRQVAEADVESLLGAMSLERLGSAWPWEHREAR